MNDFIVSIDNDLQTMALGDMPADFDIDNVIGEIIGDADTDDPLVALKVPFPTSWRDFIWVEIFGGRQVRLNRLREEHELFKAYQQSQAGEGVLMSEEKKTLEYYCANCKKSVECSISVWLEQAVQTMPDRRIAVQADARCPDCGAILASGREVLELY